MFYVATGLWPIVHMKSFEAVTGRKRDHSLSRAMGGLIAAVGLALLVRPSKILGIASAVALGGADAIFASTGRISRIYLADTVVEAAIVAAWL